jgi:hypothetical protein
MRVGDAVSVDRHPPDTAVADQPVFRSLTGVTPGEYAAEVGQRGQAGPSGNTAT